MSRNHPTAPKGHLDNGQAGERLRRSLASLDSLSSGELRQLVQELLVRQTELEQQNEEMRQSRTKLEESRRRFADLYDAAPIAYLTLDEGGVVLEANVTAARQLGLDQQRLLNRPFSAFVSRDWTVFYEHLQQVICEQTRKVCEVRLLPYQGAEFWVQLHSISVRGEGGQRHCRTAVIDISERKRAEEKLKIYHESLAKLVEARSQGIVRQPGTVPPDLEEEPRGKGVRLSERVLLTDIMDTEAALVMVLNHEGSITLFNRGLEEATGYTMEEVKGRPVWDFCQNGDPAKAQGVFANLSRGFLSGEVQYGLKTKQGAYRPISWSHTFLYGSDGLVEYVVATGQEVADPGQGPDLPLPAFEEMRLTTSGSDGPLFVHDRATGEVIDVDPAMLEQHGFTAEEAGRLRLLLDFTLRDINERQRAEETLRRREQEYRLLVNSIPAVVFRGYADWTVDFFDNKIEELTGYQKEAFDRRELTWEDVILPEDIELARAACREALATNQAYIKEYRIINARGEIRWIHMRGQIVCEIEGRIDFISGVFFDITHQKEMEARLRESEARFRNLLEYLPGVAVQGYELDGTVRYWNRASELIYGYEAQEAIGKELCALIVPADLQPLFQRCLELGRQADSSGELMPSSECQLHSADGALVPVHCIHTVVCLEGSPPLMFCINVDLRERQRVEAELRNYRDHLERLVGDRTVQLTLLNRQLLEEIAERQRTEEALRESELRFRSIFEGAPVGIGLLDLEGRDLELNPAVRSMLGYSREELPKLRHRRVIHLEDVEENRRLHRELVAGTRDSFHRECRFRRQDGSWMWGLLHVSLVRGEEGEPLFTIAMVEDITTQKAVQAEIAAYQERLRSLASELSLTEERERRRLATDLHDHIGQILALAQIKLGALRHEADSPPLADAVEEVRDFIGEAIRYTRTLTFELSLPILYDLGLEAAVEWLAEQFHTQYGLTVEVHRDQYPKPLTEASRVLLFRTVRELLTNVVKHAQARTVRINLTQGGDRLRLEVADDGQGFPEVRNLPAVGESTGFGLFSIRERLSHLGGHLEVASTPNQGTIVTVDVPLTQPEAQSKREEVEG